MTNRTGASSDALLADETTALLEHIYGRISREEKIEPFDETFNAIAEHMQRRNDRLRAQSSVTTDDAPRCPKCGYTNEDCRTLMDHHLCGEAEPPPASPEVAAAPVARSVADIIEEEIYGKSIDQPQASGVAAVVTDAMVQAAWKSLDGRPFHPITMGDLRVAIEDALMVATAQPQPRAESQPVTSVDDITDAMLTDWIVETTGRDPIHVDPTELAEIRIFLRKVWNHRALASPQAPVSPDEGERSK